MFPLPFHLPFPYSSSRPMKIELINEIACSEFIQSRLTRWRLLRLLAIQWTLKLTIHPCRLALHQRDARLLLYGSSNHAFPSNRGSFILFITWCVPLEVCENQKFGILLLNKWNRTRLGKIYHHFTNHNCSVVGTRRILNDQTFRHIKDFLTMSYFLGEVVAKMLVYVRQTFHPVKYFLDQ